MRPTVSVVIPAWNEWALTRACLDSLRPTLGLRDQVVVVDNGSRDETARGLARYSWVTVVSHEQNLGFAAGCNSGAAAARGDVLVFLNNDTLVPSRWLDGLLAPLADLGVGATGPRSNFVPGPQLVDGVTYDPRRMADLQRFARGWRDEHRRETTEVTRLVGFCLAVRRDLFTDLGGFDEGFGLGGAEDDDLCLRLIDAGHRLLIAHESFVHHHGHRTFLANEVDRLALQEQNLRRLADKRGKRQREVDPAPVLLSACMIVRDEQENLPACLESLRGIVDEVVVYDTGSSDRTREIAQEAGATVIDGYWDDDFGRARNTALEHCRGEWVLQVDADEVVSADAAALRDELSDATADALDTEIDNVGDDGEVGLQHIAVRLFRRTRARWHGRLHERVVPQGASPLIFDRSTTLRLRHFGYTTAAKASADKVGRNVRVAQAAVAADTADLHATISLARALIAAGRSDEALEHLSRVRETTEDPELLRHALRTGAEAFLGLRRPEDALAWAEQLRAHSRGNGISDYLTGLALGQQGQVDQALTALRRVDRARDEELSLPRHAVAVQSARLLVDAERWEEAADELIALARREGLPAESWPTLLEAQWRAGAGMDRLPDLLPDDAMPVLARCLTAPAEAMDLFLETLWKRSSSDPRVLAVAPRLAAHLSLERAMDWSARLRSNGFPQDCTLAGLAAADSAAPLERLRACAVLHEAVDDRRGLSHLGPVAAAVPVGELPQALLALDELSPRLLGRFIELAATDAVRSRSLADVLSALGADEQAELILARSAG